MEDDPRCLNCDNRGLVLDVRDGEEILLCLDCGYEMSPDALVSTGPSVTD